MNGADIKEEKPSPNPNEGEHIVRAQHMPLSACLQLLVHCKDCRNQATRA